MRLLRPMDSHSSRWTSRMALKTMFLESSSLGTRSRRVLTCSIILLGVCVEGSANYRTVLDMEKAADTKQCDPPEELEKILMSLPSVGVYLDDQDLSSEQKEESWHQFFQVSIGTCRRNLIDRRIQEELMSRKQEFEEPLSWIDCRPSDCIVRIL